MSRAARCFISSCFVLASSFHCFADASDPSDQPAIKAPVVKAQQQPVKAFHPFTGKVIKNKVRLRLQPTLDSHILNELNRDDMLVILGETDDFYAVQPPSDVKAYIFRTYVLDGVVEGNRVNVRLEPELSSPVIAQLNSGEKIQGIISGDDKKWLEIAPPASTRFYIAKEYIENIGEPSLLAAIQKQREEIDTALNSVYLNSQSELQKPFEEIHLEGMQNELNKIMASQDKFPTQAVKAKELSNSIQEIYLQKKAQYIDLKHKAMTAEKSPVIQKIDMVTKETTAPSNTASPVVANAKMEEWLPVEQKLFDVWSVQHPNATIDDFYNDQTKDAVTLNGVVDSYIRMVKNKPGDYVLTNVKSGTPIAYLYSTKNNLKEWAGHEVTIKALPRENNNFAFPAYFVLTIE